MYTKTLTHSDFEIITSALESEALDKESPIRKKAEKLFHIFNEALDIQITIDIEEKDGGEQRMLDALEAIICRGETSYGDD